MNDRRQMMTKAQSHFLVMRAKTNYLRRRINTIIYGDFIHMSDCCLTPIQLYHGENKLIFQRDDDEVRFVLDQHA